MQIIKAPNSKTNVFLTRACKVSEGKPYRLHRYCLIQEVIGGVLLYNMLNQCLLFIDEHEAKDFLSVRFEELKQLSYIIAEESDDKLLVSQLRNVLKMLALKKGSQKRTYDIMTTLDCNARCFYCFEKGQPRTKMTIDTADAVARYIINQHDNQSVVKIRWFGGEPLYNDQVIDAISAKLREEKVSFISTMTSNGYLFDDQMVSRALSVWNLKEVQITLDGTEEVYNRSKAYIYKGVNAYERVINNIICLCENGIKVIIRLNIDIYNADDLMSLVQELSARFEGLKHKPHGYSHTLFEECKKTHNSAEQQSILLSKQIALEHKLIELGLAIKPSLPKEMRYNRCMADCGHASLITPTGQLGVCEHFSNQYIAGDVWNGINNQDVVDQFCEVIEEPFCKECTLFPICIKLKSCPSSGNCTVEERDMRINKIRRAMEIEWRNMQVPL